eukprot:358826-Chlamydomonas_euryale.AAC.7
MVHGTEKGRGGVLTQAKRAPGAGAHQRAQALLQVVVLFGEAVDFRKPALDLGVLDEQAAPRAVAVALEAL